VALKVRRSRVHANTLLAEQVNEKRTRLVVAFGEAGLVTLVLLHILHVLIKEVSRVKRTALGFWVELGTEDGTGVVDKTLVGLIVQVGKVLPPLARQSRRVDGVSVVLRRDVALASGKIERGDVVSAVSVLELDGLCAGSERNQLVPHADAHDGYLRRLEELAEVVHGSGAVGWVTRAVGDEDTVEVVRDLVDGVVKGEAGDAGTARNETAEDVLLDTAVD